jgi:hypothetical protein
LGPTRRCIIDNTLRSTKVNKAILKVIIKDKINTIKNSNKQ